ncbi:F0F1 ATP synthase subunit epsilon [Persephonella sp.]
MKLLKLKFITPDVFREFDVKFLSLNDIEGSIGIYPGHMDFLTVLPRSYGYFIDENDKKVYFAYDFGVMSVEKNRASITTRILITGLSIEELKSELEKKIERTDVYEKKLRENLRILERMILKEIVNIER